MPVRVSRDQHSFDSSPELFAVFHALQSLLTPRHPPCALSSLTTLIQRSPTRLPPCDDDRAKRKPEFSALPLLRSSGCFVLPPAHLHSSRHASGAKRVTLSIKSCERKKPSHRLARNRSFETALCHTSRLLGTHLRSPLKALENNFAHAARLPRQTRRPAREAAHALVQNKMPLLQQPNCQRTRKLPDPAGRQTSPRVLAFRANRRSAK